MDTALVQGNLQRYVYVYTYTHTSMILSKVFHAIITYVCTHKGVEIDTCTFQTTSQLSSAASGMSLELCFRHNFSDMKRTCWTIGSWRSCLNLRVMSSIPAGSTIIHRFLFCEFICTSLCQIINIKLTIMYIHIYAYACV